MKLHDPAQPKNNYHKTVHRGPNIRIWPPCQLSDRASALDVGSCAFDPHLSFQRNDYGTSKLLCLAPANQRKALASSLISGNRFHQEWGVEIDLCTS